MTSGWRIALWVAVVAVALGFLYLVRGILLPFIVAFIIAALLDPLVHKLRLKGMSRKFAVATVVLPIYFAGLLVLAMLVPRITSDILRLNSTVDEFATNLSQSSALDNYFVRWNPEVQAQQKKGFDGSVDKILNSFEKPLTSLGLPASRREIMQKYVEPERPKIGAAVRQGFESFFGFLAGFAHNIIGLIVLMIVPPLLLLELEDIRRRAPQYIPPSIRGSTLKLFAEIGQVFMKYLRGVATVMLLYALCASILLTLFSVPYSILLGILFAALYMVPYLGNLIVYAVLFSVIGFTNTDHTFFMHLGSPWSYALVTTVIYAVMGVIFDQLLYPSLVGNAVGLNTVTSIFVVLCGNALFGLIGMIIAFPLAGAIKIILDKLIKVTSTTQDKIGLPSVPLRHRRSTT